MDKPTEQPDKIEKRCWCGRCRRWYERWIDSLHQDDIEGPCYCPDCGYLLHKNGFAYRMVRASIKAEDLAQGFTADYPIWLALLQANRELAEEARAETASDGEGGRA